MATNQIYESYYSKSWAFVIGIDNYLSAPKLSHARNDAEAFANTLVDRFSFPAENIVQLYDQHATRTKS